MMGVYDFESLQAHVGHKIECVAYGTPDDVLNVAVECLDCSEVLVDYDKPEEAAIHNEDRGMNMTTSQAVPAASRSAISQSVYFMLQHSKDSSLDYEEIIEQWANHFFEHATEDEKIVFKEELQREVKEGSYNIESLKETLAFILGHATEIYEWVIAMIEEETV